MKTLKKRLEEEPHYVKGKILVYPVILTKKMWGEDPDFAEFYLERHLRLIEDEGYKKIPEFRDKKIEVLILTDSEPVDSLKKLAEKYGIKIEVDPKRIEKVREEMMEVLDKKRKRTKGMGHIRV